MDWKCCPCLIGTTHCVLQCMIQHSSRVMSINLIIYDLKKMSWEVQCSVKCSVAGWSGFSSYLQSDKLDFEINKIISMHSSSSVYPVHGWCFVKHFLSFSFCSEPNIIQITILIDTIICSLRLAQWVFRVLIEITTPKVSAGAGAGAGQWNARRWLHRNLESLAVITLRCCCYCCLA